MSQKHEIESYGVFEIVRPLQVQSVDEIRNCTGTA